MVREPCWVGWVQMNCPPVVGGSRNNHTILVLFVIFLMTKTSSQKARAVPKTAKKRKVQPSDVMVRPPKGGNPEGRGSLGAAMTRRMRSDAPTVTGSPFSGDGSVTVRHREYIADIAGSVAYANVAFSINAGLIATFAWLSQIANCYESYTFRKLRFLFETDKSSATSGSVMLSVDFNASDAAPVSKTAQMALFNSVRSAVWDECAWSADKADLVKLAIQRYIRNSALAANLDIKTYDLGTLFVGTTGCADTSTIGELYVEYEVKFHTPILLQSGSSGQGQHITGFTSISNASMLGSAPTSLGQLYFSASSNTLTCLVAGQYLCWVALQGTVIHTASDATTGTATSAALSTIHVVSNQADTSGSFMISIVAAVGQTVIFNVSGASSISASSCRIAQYLLADA